MYTGHVLKAHILCVLGQVEDQHLYGLLPVKRICVPVRTSADPVNVRDIHWLYLQGADRPRLVHSQVVAPGLDKDHGRYHHR